MKNIKIIVVTSIVVAMLTIGFSVASVKLVEIPKFGEVVVSTGSPVMSAMPTETKQETISAPKPKPETEIISAQEARLRSIESRLSELEKRIK